MINEQIQGYADAAQDRRRKARRLLAVGDLPSAVSEFATALEQIQAGLNRLSEEESPDSRNPTDEDRDLATLFADLQGIKGGIYRDMVALDPSNAERSIKAYDAGARYERDFALKSTYNFVNQLVVRFVALPDLLNDQQTSLTLEGRNGDLETDSVAGWLDRADQHVEDGYSRRDDPAWALADLVLLGALRSSSDLPKRLIRFESQVDRDRDIYPYASLDRVIGDLLRVTSPNSTVGASLRELAGWLKPRLPAS